MAGYLPKLKSTEADDYDNQGHEASGVYSATLTEDMIETVRKCRKLYVDAFIPEFYFDDKDYPLTHVPSYLSIYPLLKDTKVLIKFYDGNPRYPYLHKIFNALDGAAEEDTDFFTDPEKLEDGDLVAFPEIGQVRAVHEISKDYWVVISDDVTLFHRGLQTVALTEDTFYASTDNYFYKSIDRQTETDTETQLFHGEVSRTYEKPLEEVFEDTITRTIEKKVAETFNAEWEVEVAKAVVQSFKDKYDLNVTKDLTVDVKGKSEYKSAQKTSIKAMGSISIAKILSDSLDALASTSPTTMGSPASQVFHPGIIAKLLSNKAQLDTGFE